MLIQGPTMAETQVVNARYRREQFSQSPKVTFTKEMLIPMTHVQETCI